LSLLEAAIDLERLAAELPVSAKQQQQIRTVPMPLAYFKNGLFARDIIAAMPVDQHEPAEFMLNEVLQQTAKHIQVSARRRRKRAGKIEVML